MIMITSKSVPRFAGLLALTSMLSLGACLATFEAVGAEEPGWDASKLPPVSNKTGLTYEKDIKAIFEKSCLECHSGEKPKSKYLIGARETAIKGGSSGDAAVIPGNSAKSPLVAYASDIVLDMEMPPTDKRDMYPKLTAEQIGLIRAWIDQGAK